MGRQTVSAAINNQSVGRLNNAEVHVRRAWSRWMIALSSLHFHSHASHRYIDLRKVAQLVVVIELFQSKTRLTAGLETEEADRVAEEDIG